MTRLRHSWMGLLLPLGGFACSVVVTPGGGEGGSVDRPDDGNGVGYGEGPTTSSGRVSSSSTGCPPPIGDCDTFACPGGAPPSFVAEECTLQCVCPPSCSSNDECSADQFCRFYDQQCGVTTQGMGACAPRNGCIPDGPACGCDGQTYASACDAWAAGQSTTLAPGTDCDAERVPCTADPGATSCYAANEWCQIVEGVASCQRFGYTLEPCEDLACGCLDQVYDDWAYTCTCTVLPSGLHVVTCG